MLSLMSLDRVYLNFLVLNASENPLILDDISSVEEVYSDFLSKESIVPISGGAIPYQAEFGGIKIVSALVDSDFVKVYEGALFRSHLSKELIRNPDQHSVWTPIKFVTVLRAIKTDLDVYWELLSNHIRVIVLDALEPFGSASASYAIGVFGVNCKNQYNVEDLIEMVVHELVHNLAFIDNLNTLHFVSDSGFEEVEVFSPIRNEMRPIHLSAHALYVAIELLRLRLIRGTFKSKSNIHPDAEALLESSIETISQIRQNNHLLTSHGLDLLAACEHQVMSIKSDAL